MTQVNKSKSSKKTPVKPTRKNLGAKAKNTQGAKPLIIVESPAKARTLAQFLGSDFVIESSIGHIRDLPRNAAEIPATYKHEAWARLGVDTTSGFKPIYVVTKEKQPQVKKLKALLSSASELYLATDEDREGESIAWHLTEVLGPKIPTKRMVFHEITPQAIDYALHNTRKLDEHLVNAQEARRILDRLYGYEISPVLWKKISPGLSAGRVQSVATRLIVTREKARMGFRQGSWWSCKGIFIKDSSQEDDKNNTFPAELSLVNSLRVAEGKDFDDETGSLKKGANVHLLDAKQAEKLKSQFVSKQFHVEEAVEKPYTRSPAPPFITSTLQQEAARKLYFSATRTMAVAQHLYEQGWITYMRTDSVALSKTAINAARNLIDKLYGTKYIPPKPRYYSNKSKNAQEAHEAIRPAGEVFKTVGEAANAGLSSDEIKLYELIFKRTLASQMSDAKGTSVTVQLGAATASTKVIFTARGRTISFQGFLKVYVEGSDDPESQSPEIQTYIPPLKKGDTLKVMDMETLQHLTQPPPRYNEASLIKTLEELGIGRPSTYASIIATIIDRGYVWKKSGALIPTFKAFAVVALMEQYFTKLVDYGFTAEMEDDLDTIACGKKDSSAWLSKFYFGTNNADNTGDNGAAVGSDAVAHTRGLKQDVNDKLAEIDAREINSFAIGKASDGQEILLRIGRFGPYLQKGDQRVTLSDQILPDEINKEKAEELLNAPSEQRVLGVDPETQSTVMLKKGRFGPYVELADAPPPPVEKAPETKAATTKTTKGKRGDKRTAKEAHKKDNKTSSSKRSRTKQNPPKRASLPQGITEEEITLDQALQLLSLPKELGTDPSTGQKIVLAWGRFGPYLKKDTETRSLENENQVFSITLEDALALFAQPKRYRTAAQPLKELGNDPEMGTAMVVKKGRFGPYLTDGKTNVSLRGHDTIESLTPERAIELLAEKRATATK
ncbi:MAG: type I DNA topoisomerase [Actinobacteria bacterium]|nr:type I DNA topoisomerase [Actinomycetota bacterium]MCL6104311.1 type I DNA topoisomerase [Actinomycetota bacterium]